MAFVLTYNSAVSSLINYFERNDQEFLDAIPSFFTFAINKISASLKALGLEIIANFSTTISSNVLQKPSYYRSSISIELIDSNGNINILQKRLLEYCRMYWPNESNKGQPIYYGDIDYNNLLLVPTPDQVYQCRLNYFATLSYLDENNQTNWATEFAPQLLFKALLREGAIFTRADERLAVFDKEYEAELNSLIVENKVRKFDRTSQGDLA